MGRPLGSQNKDKPFRSALQRYIAAQAGEAGKLDELAEKLFAVAMKGDTGAIKEIADRLDGKVPQAIGGTDELDPVRMIVTGVPREGE